MRDGRERVLSAIHALCVDGWPTTVREVATACDLTVSTVHEHVRQLRRLGLVEVRGKGRSGIRPKVAA